MTSPGANPPGWYTDPYQAAPLRYWDGNQWTEHVSGWAVGPSPDLLVERERRWLPWARLGFVIWAVGQAGSVSFTVANFSNLPNYLDRTSSEPGKIDVGTGALFAGAQLCSILSLVGLVGVVIWLYRAVEAARSLGLASPRSSGLAAASFIIPIVNFWWPYTSARECAPMGHVARSDAARWWTFYIASTSVGVLFVFALASPTTGALLAGLVVLCTGLSAMFGRSMIRAVLDAHEELLASHRARSAWS